MSSTEQKLSSKFPQYVEHGDGSSRLQSLYRGPEDFRAGDGAKHLRLERVSAYSLTEHGVALELAGEIYENRFVQTHETQMYQFAERGPHHSTGGRIEFFSPGVIRIRFGEDPDRDPYRDLPRDSRMLIAQQDSALSAKIVREEATSIELSENLAKDETGAGNLRIRIDLDPFRVALIDASGREVWAQKKRDLFTSDVFDAGQCLMAGRTAFFDSFELRERERIVGLGERFDGVLRNGRPVDFRNKDAIGTSSRRTYINVPFYMSSNGYGLFLNSSANPEWEIGTKDFSALGLGIEDDVLDYFVIYGPEPATILSRYHVLTGFAPVPPVWSFGLWLSRNSYTSWDVVDEVVSRADNHGLPFDVVHLDTAWFAEDWNCDLRFSPERFPEPAAHMESLRDRGVRVSLWQYNFIPPLANNRNYHEALEKGYLVADSDGKPFAYPEGTFGSWIDDVTIDFTNPDVATWYADQIRGLIKDGAATIKVDFGEGVPDEGIYHSVHGSRIHNLYSLIYTSVVARAIHDETGEWIVWARSGTAGSQRYPVHWGGDSQSSWSGLHGTVKGAISTGLSGIPFYSHDIGGFIGRPGEELYIRWAQFGLLSSHARSHGNGNENSREPWSFGSDAERIFKRFAELRYSLLPYLLSVAQEASKSGMPVIRSLLLEFPDDFVAWHVEDQYLFGSDVLVAPVVQPLEQAPTREVYLPGGTWYNYWTQERVDSDGRWFTVALELDTIPVFVRAGAIIPYTSARRRTENTITPIERVEAYAGTRSRSTRRVDADGTVIEFTFDGTEIRVTPALDAKRVIIGSGGEA